ncbi:V-type proton ATPase subunit S1-like protein isoform X2 [Cavia porcellus]|uniref:V-type proton ATPase subunit S1-like protein isoform X2 n=1 Tax=Cavia porcellus TaxID=10141 RepID=UPI000350E0B1|nr:V-type proton ATPase subunit S1-like protein isoform X2 [Cavia porcellus]
MENHKLNRKGERGHACLLSSRTSANKEAVVKSDQQVNGDVKPVQNFSPVPITQAPQYNQSRGGHGDREHRSVFSPQNPIRVSLNGIPCILFWARRITVTFENQTWLDLTEGTFGQKAAVDTHSSSCGEERATLYLKFGDTENPEALAVRFVLASVSDGEGAGPRGFRLHQVEVLLNGSAQAAFAAPGVGAPPGLSFRCSRVSSLRRDRDPDWEGDALLPLLPPQPGHASWGLTLLGLQLQGFAIRGGQFAKARDCATSFSLAILIGLAMSLVLLLVLAYALHMLFYLRYLDRHYECIAASPVHFRQSRACRGTEEKELLGSQGAESYELQGQQICRVHV